MKLLRAINRASCSLSRVGTIAKRCDGTAAVEFAIVGPAFIGLVLAILYTALIFLAQQMLETAALASARLLLTGSAQTIRLANGTVGMSASDLKNAICNGTTGTNSSGAAVTIAPLLPPMLSCSRLTVNVSTANTYNVASTTAPTFTYNSQGVITSTNTGYNTQSNGNGQSQIVVLQLIYLWPTGVGPLGLNLTNQPNGNRMLVATSVSTTEAYSCNSGQTSC
ncbi:TadE/TadG family type IV pilus assembly protein [Sphingomonas glacialis]|uniref:TadE/TadG family type IV pilus assembly protein n=1 Tax=Sphingomonas glacialis TaxID=658225 RepID=UPI001671E3A8|nr:TadE/TadG family type IV pilus assembly protein [Sphingomonas glacialis]